MRIILCLVIALLVPAQAADKPSIKYTPVAYTHPVAGPEMYKAYCATCHGLDAKGTGPAAVALKVPPSDLTTLSKRNHGEFPTVDVYNTLVGKRIFGAHGTAEMPIWGPVLRSLDPSNRQVADLRMNNLTEYIKTLQR